MKIVFTNGCFDLLHPGHAYFLRECKKLGDHLIVAVDTDASVKALKGPDRPYNPLAQRIKELKMGWGVDAVIPWGGGDLTPLLQIIQPDILVKGDDYKVGDISGAQYMRLNHKRVELVKRSGYSTTEQAKYFNSVG